MKLKYYIRGIGIGIVVTALILHFANRDPEKVHSGLATNKEDNQKLVLNESGNDISNNSVSDNKKPVVLSDNKVSDNRVSDNSVSDNTTSKNDVSGNGESDNKVSDNTVSKDDVHIEDGNYTYIVISKGEGSYAVAKSVQQAGLIESAAEFDAYLCSNGYDKRLTVGSHKVFYSSDFKKIAQCLTSSVN